MVLSRKKLKAKLKTLLADSIVSSESKASSNSEEIVKQLESVKEKLKDSKPRPKRPRRKKKTPLLDGSDKKENDDDGSVEVEGNAKEEKEKNAEDAEEVDGATDQSDAKKRKMEEKKNKMKKKKQKRKKIKTKKEDEPKEKESEKYEGVNVNENAKKEFIAPNQSDNIVVSDENAKKVYVGGIPYYSTEDDIKSFFESCGTVSDIDCMTFPETGKFRGIAILTFKTEAAAKRALALDGSDMGGFYLKIQPYKGKNANRPDFAPQIIQGYNRIYVGNLAWDITEEDLQNFFQNFKISTIKFGTDKITGDFKGYAHVDFEESNSVLSAIKMDQTLIRGRPVRISCAVPRKKTNDVDGSNVIIQENHVNTEENKEANEKDENEEEGQKKNKRRTCYECGTPGHISSECPNKQNYNNSNEGNKEVIENDANEEEGQKKNKRRTCYECGTPGHISSECPNKQNYNHSNGNEVIIQQDEGYNDYKMGGEEPVQDVGKKKKRRTCYECGTPGHLSSECPNKKNNEGNDVIIQEKVVDQMREEVEQAEHVQEASKKKKNKRRTCYECGTPGHLSSECPNKKH